MGLLDAWHSYSDLKTKKHDRALARQESDAKVSHTASESRRIDVQAELERARLNHQIAMDAEKMRMELLTLGEQITMARDAHARGANITFGNLSITYPRAAQIEQLEPEAIPAELPGRIDFIEILEAWRPSFGQIFLGLAPGGEHITVPVPALCHVALAGSTGAGKSNLMRLLLAQLLFVNCYVVICDPHFCSVDAENGDDWRPIERRLAVEPAIYPKQIKDVLSWAALDALPKRLELRRRGQKVGKPVFIALDELPSIVNDVREAPDLISRIVREGRKVGIFMISSSQDFLVKTIGGSGAVRDCYRTALYSGGDARTAQVLLDTRGNVDDGSLGKGIVMSRSAAQPQAAMMRVPYASNASLYRLLGVPAQYDDVPDEDDSEEHFDPYQERRERLPARAGGIVDDVPETPTNHAQNITRQEREQIIRLARAGVTRRNMCQALGKGKAYYDTVKTVLDEEGL